MTGYHCILCDFHTKIKSHYDRHLNTKKHQNNVEEEKEKKKNEIKEKIKESCTCEFCGKCLSSKQSLKRHVEKACIKNKNSVKSKKFKAELEKMNNMHKNCLNNKKKEENKHDKKKYYEDIDISSEDSDAEYKPNMNNNNNHNTHNFYNDLSDSDEEELNNMNQQNKNDPFHNFMDNFKNPNNTNTNTKVTHNTRVTINGIDVGDNPLQKPGIKKALIAAFKHPFFKNNLNYVPVNFFEDDDFRENFNEFHELSIENPKVNQLDFIENMNEHISKSISQSLNNTVIEPLGSDGDDDVMY